MADLKMTTDVENIKKMSTFPNRDEGMSAEQVKARFDQAAVDIKKHINEVIAPAVEENQAVAQKSVLFSEQTLKKEQQEQVRQNIGAAPNTAILHEVQLLTGEQREQARANIGAASQVEANSFYSRLKDGGLVLNDHTTGDDYSLSIQKGKLQMGGETFLTDEDEQRILEETCADKVLCTEQKLTDEQKAQARENIRALEVPYKMVAIKTLEESLDLSEFGTIENDSGEAFPSNYFFVPKLDYLDSIAGFDFTLNMVLDGESYTIKKADCTITSTSEDGTLSWNVSSPLVEGTLFTIEQNEKRDNTYIALGGYIPTSLTLELYSVQYERVDVPVVTTVNGAEPDENGNVQMRAVLYEKQDLTDGQKINARDNIGAVGTSDLKAVSDLIPKTKQYEHIATIAVTADADGNLPQHVIFSADSEGNPFELTDFIVQASAGFVDGSKSGLYMSVNNNKLVFGNSAVSGISATPRSFTIFYRQENDGSVRAEHTTSGSSTSFYNPATAINESRVVAPKVMTDFAGKTVTKIDLYTLTGDTKAWVEGSTFELWGVRA